MQAYYTSNIRWWQPLEVSLFIVNWKQHCLLEYFRLGVVHSEWIFPCSLAPWSLYPLLKWFNGLNSQPPDWSTWGWLYEQQHDVAGSQLKCLAGSLISPLMLFYLAYISISSPNNSNVRHYGSVSFPKGVARIQCGLFIDPPPDNWSVGYYSSFQQVWHRCRAVAGGDLRSTRSRFLAHGHERREVIPWKESFLVAIFSAKLRDAEFLRSPSSVNWKLSWEQSPAYEYQLVTRH